MKSLSQHLRCSLAIIFGAVCYFGGITNPSTCIAAGPILWIDDSQGEIGTVDVHTGAVTLVGNSGIVLTDIAFDPSGNLWGISFTDLYKLNKATGAATLVGSTGISHGNSLVFGTDGTLYAASNSTDLLYTINKTTGAGSSIGNIGFISDGDLAFDQGNLYESDGNGALLKITLSPSVSGTEVGPLGFSSVFGLATGDDNILYGVAGTQIFSVNTSTGQGTLTTDYSGHGLLAANGTSFVTEAVPEPSSVLFLGMMSVGGLIRRRR
jgi:hypothetical protein